MKNSHEVQDWPKNLEGCKSFGERIDIYDIYLAKKHKELIEHAKKLGCDPDLVNWAIAYMGYGYCSDMLHIYDFEEVDQKGDIVYLYVSHEMPIEFFKGTNEEVGKKLNNPNLRKKVIFAFPK